jgi:hypothetical protein
MSIDWQGQVSDAIVRHRTSKDIEFPKQDEAAPDPSQIMAPPALKPPKAPPVKLPPDEEEYDVQDTGTNWPSGRQSIARGGMRG